MMSSSAPAAMTDAPTRRALDDGDDAGVVGA
jgi:hypothetical protein